MVTLALTMGDPSGIGPEILVKLLDRRADFPSVAFVVCGVPSVFRQTARALSIPIDWPEKGPKDIAMLKKIPVVIVTIFVVRGLGIYGQEYFMSYVGLGIIRQLRNRLYDRIQDLPLAFFHQENS